MNGEVEIKLTLDDAEMKHIMYNAATVAERATHSPLMRKLINMSQEISIKINRMYENRGGDKGNNIAAQKRAIYIDEIAALKNDEYYFDATCKIVQNSIEELTDIIKDIKELKFEINKNYDTNYIKKAARILRELYSFNKAYKKLIDELYTFLNSEEFNNLNPTEYNKDQFEAMVSGLNSMLRRSEIQYKDMSKPLFMSFIMKFAQPSFGIKINGKVVDEEFYSKLLDEAEKDIS
jgi:hypothetical protein